MKQRLGWTDGDGDKGTLCDAAESRSHDAGPDRLALLGTRDHDSGNYTSVFIDRNTARAAVAWLRDFYDLDA